MASIRSIAADAARRHGLDENLFLRQMGAESNFSDVTSPAGAQGYAQLMPGTARGLHVNPHDPHQAFDAAARLMAGYVRKFGSYEKALRAYNAGPAGVEASYHYGETNAYVKKILGGTASAAGRRASGQNPSAVATVSVRSKVTPGVDPTVTPAHEVPDPQAAIQMALSQSNPNKLPKLGSGGVATNALRLLQSGAATKTIPTQMSNGRDASVSTQITARAATRRATGTGDTSAKGAVDFEGTKVAAWIADALHAARAEGWKGKVNSGWRSDAEQTRIYNSGVRPAAKPRSLGGGGSNHEMTAFPGGAVDVTDPAGLAAALAKTKYKGKLVWAGGKDPVHFSHPHNGSY